MSYADKLLSTGERITKRERQHWFVLLWGSRLAILAIILLATGLKLVGAPTPVVLVVSALAIVFAFVGHLGATATAARAAAT